MKSLYQFTKIAQSLQHNIRPLFAFGLFFFIQKQENIWYQITPSSLNQHVFYEFRKQEGNDKFLKSTLTISDKLIFFTPSLM